ncbi:hypothetical protein LDENG_00119090 [Lucifuga dentata]|nr:hypothetical protein LDENG_00119090 [Lucifuga dentata]
MRQRVALRQSSPFPFCVRYKPCLYFRVSVRRTQTRTPTLPINGPSRSLMSCPRSFQQIRRASKMLTDASTEDELVSKKGNVSSSFGSCSVLRFTARSFYKLYRPVCSTLHGVQQTGL